MIRITVCIFTFFSFLSCNSNEANQPSRVPPKELSAFNMWEKEYKNVTFQRCLLLGFSKSDQIRNLMKLDNSTHQDFAFGLEQYKYIDSIVQPIIKRAKIDSIRNYKDNLDGMNVIEQNELNGLPLMKYCLEFYESDELNRIANQRINQMKFLWQD